MVRLAYAGFWNETPGQSLWGVFSDNRYRCHCDWHAGGSGFLELFNPTLDIGVVRNAIDDRYWMLLFLPITLPTLLLLYTKQLVLPWEVTAAKWLQWENTDRAVFSQRLFCHCCLVAIP